MLKKAGSQDAEKVQVLLQIVPRTVLGETIVKVLYFKSKYSIDIHYYNVHLDYFKD